MAAVAYAGLRLREGGIREGRLAVDLLPLSRDAYERVDCATYLALIYTKVGECLPWYPIGSSLSTINLASESFWVRVRHHHLTAYPT